MRLPKPRAKPRLKSWKARIGDSADLEGAELAALDELDWRTSGPYDIGEVSDIESTEASPRIDLGSLILTAISGSELRLQVAEETGEIASAMLVIETIVEPPASANQETSGLFVGTGAGGVRGPSQRWPVG